MSLPLALLLLVFSGFSFLWGFEILTNAKSALHEIEAFLMFLISAVFFSSFAVTAALAELIRMAKREAPPRPPKKLKDLPPEPAC